MSMFSDRPAGAHEGRPLAYVTTRTADERHLIIRPGADPADVIAACEQLPAGAVYRDFTGGRQHIALIFRPLPFQTDTGEAPTRPATPTGTLPVAADGGWVPTLPLDRPADAVDRARERHARTRVPAFWTTRDGQVIDGPWADRAEATQAATAHRGGMVAYGTLAADGTLISRAAPDTLAWDRMVTAELAGVIDDDGAPVRATRDATALLTVQVARALMLAGVPLADATERGAPRGGALLVPARAIRGVVLGWTVHPLIDVPAPVRVSLADMMALSSAAALDAMGFTIAYQAHSRVPIITAAPGKGPTTSNQR